VTTIDAVRAYQERGQQMAVSAAAAHGLEIDDVFVYRSLVHGPHPKPLGGDGRTDALILANCYTFKLEVPQRPEALPPEGPMDIPNPTGTACFLRLDAQAPTSKQQIAFFLHLAGGVGGSTRGQVDSLTRAMKDYYWTRPQGPYAVQQGWWVARHFADRLGVRLDEVDTTDIPLGAE
jgi:hypothetical protein